MRTTASPPSSARIAPATLPSICRPPLNRMSPVTWDLVDSKVWKRLLGAGFGLGFFFPHLGLLLLLDQRLHSHDVKYTDLVSRRTGSNAHASRERSVQI